MGHLVNPISNRLSINNYWTANWKTYNRFSYSKVLKKDLFIYLYLDWMLKFIKYKKLDLIVTNFKIYRVSGDLFLNIYYYNASDKQITNRMPVYKIYQIFYKHDRRFKRRTNKYFLRHRFSVCFTKLLNDLAFSTYWYLLSAQMEKTIKLLNHDNHFKLYFNAIDLTNNFVNPETITNYITKKLQQRYSVKWVLKPVVRDLNFKIKKKIISGFKIRCAGRFTKKQRASVTWANNGAVPLSTMNANIHYDFKKVRLKYGLCGVKVWLYYNKKYSPKHIPKFNHPDISYNNYFINNHMEINFNSLLFRKLRIIIPATNEEKYKNLVFVRLLANLATLNSIISNNFSLFDVSLLNGYGIVNKSGFGKSKNYTIYE